MKPSLVILGAGFAGLKMAQLMSKSNLYDIVLIDRYNFHQFQPLLYQVATSGLEPSSISFPLRKAFQKMKNVRIRWAEVISVDTANKTLETSVGEIRYDKLIIAMGADTNYFGNKQIERNALSMKSVPESLLLRNELLTNYEKASVTNDPRLREALLNVVIVGGGATGVELAGAIAEMKNNILQKDYPEIDFSGMKIYLIERGQRLLAGMSDYASRKSLIYLHKLGVEVLLDTAVNAYDGMVVETSSDNLLTKCFIWAAGIKANSLPGIDPAKQGRAGRLLVDTFNMLQPDIYAIGDIAFISDDPKFPNGHPQVAPVAIQQAKNLSKNLIREAKGLAPRPFKYNNQGSMATVGRNLAVVELPHLKLGGFFAWLIWMFVHLMSIVGVKNRLWVFFNWLWNYITYDVSLRLIIKPAKKNDSSC